LHASDHEVTPLHWEDTSQMDWSLLDKGIRRIEGLPLWIDGSRALTVHEILGKCRKINKQHGLDLIVSVGE